MKKGDAFGIVSCREEFELGERFGHVDVTPVAEGWVAASAIANGTLALQAVGSTAGLTTIEYEPGALSDLERALESLAPVSASYAHDARWGDGNGFSHLRSALMRTEMVLPIVGGRIALGTWQQIVLMNFDNRPRRRPLIGIIQGA